MPVRGAGREQGAQRIAEEQEQTATDAVAESYGTSNQGNHSKGREAGEGLAKTQLMTSINKASETGVVARDL